MNVLFDTSVLVPAFVDQLANHPAAFTALSTYTTGGNQGFCSAHALAETYAALTALPLPKRIRTAEARMLIEENILAHLNIVDLEREAYIRALDSAATKGLSSGSIYDALHVEAAIKASCLRICTYNIEHFRALSPDQIQVTSP